MNIENGFVPAPPSSAFLSIYQSAAARAPAASLGEATMPSYAPAGGVQDAWICAQLGLGDWGLGTQAAEADLRQAAALPAGRTDPSRA